MDLRFGFTLDAPAVTVPWNSFEADLQRLIGPGLHHVTAGYWTMPIEVIAELEALAEES
jgi:hypothetical protein